MIEIGGAYLSIFLARGMIQICVIGMLINELFDRKRKNRFEIFWLLSITLLWTFFLGISDYGIFTGGLHVFLSSVAIISFVLALGLFIAVIARRFKIINRALAFPTVILASAMLVIVLIDRYQFFPAIMLPMTIASFIVTLLGAFVFIDFLIKTSEGYKAKPKKEFPWKKIILICGGLLIVGAIFLVSLFSFTGHITLAPPEKRVELSGELNIYNWEDYFDENARVLDEFEEEFGVKINLYTFETEAELVDSVKNYRGVYDLIIPIDMLFKDFIMTEKLEKINKDNIPNLKNIDSKFSEHSYNPGFDYGVPYLWGTTGLAINTKYIPEDTDSWEILWNPEYADKIGIMSNEVELFGLGARYVGVPLVPSRISDLRKINDFLELQKELIGEYEAPHAIIKDMINEDLWVSVAWSVDTGIMTHDNPNIKYIIPKEGTSKWIEHMVIPKGATNKENAEAFINYILRPEVYARIANYQSSPGVNEPAREFINKAILGSDVFNVADEDWDKLQAYSDFDPSDEILKMRHKMWEELIQ